MSKYKYTSIKDEERAFRLLKLYKGYHNEPIRCELWHSYLPDCSDEDHHERPDYIALSYTWGGKAKNATIEVSGRPLRVTRILFRALQDIRSIDHHQDLWVDAVCINQRDPDERSHQVEQMRIIYQEALGVYVWLGRNTTRTDKCMNAMIQVEKRSLTVDNKWSLTMEERGQHGLESRNPDDIWTPSIRKGLSDLLGRPWFRRIWILQEIASARMAKIFCGTKSVSARTFTRFPSLLSVKPDSQCQAVLDIMPGRSRRTSWWAERRDLYTLLSKFRHCQATKPQDKIYALLGISEECPDGKSFKIDYGSRIEQIIERTIRFLLSHLRLRIPPGSLHWSFEKFQQNLDHLGAIVFETVMGRPQDYGRDVYWELALGISVKRGSFQETSFALDWRHWESPQRLRSHMWANRYSFQADDPEESHEKKAHEEVLRGSEIGRALLAYTKYHGFTNTTQALEQLFCRSETGQALLTYTAHHGFIDTAEALFHLYDAQCHRKKEYKEVAVQTNQISISSSLPEDGHTYRDLKDSRGRNPMSYAAEHGHENIAILLSMHGDLDADMRDNVGRTPLSYAAQNGCSEIAKMLFSRRQIDVDSKDIAGRTPLSYAAENKHVDLAALLIANGANIRLKDSTGRTPLRIGLRQKDEQLTELLKTHAQRSPVLQ